MRSINACNQSCKRLWRTKRSEDSVGKRFEFGSSSWEGFWHFTHSRITNQEQGKLDNQPLSSSTGSSLGSLRLTSWMSWWVVYRLQLLLRLSQLSNNQSSTAGQRDRREHKQPLSRKRAQTGTQAGS
jgi:hypothetical protein